MRSRFSVQRLRGFWVFALRALRPHKQGSALPLTTAGASLIGKEASISFGDFLAGLKNT